MKKVSFWMSLLTVAISFAGGFLLANALNRNELDDLRAETERAKAAAVNAQANPTPQGLSADEIKAKIAEADASPTNIEFQRNLGVGLYRYGSMQKDTELLGESARLLERAYKAAPDDHQLQLTLGHAYFDIGYFGKDNEMLLRSREFYEKALKTEPGNADIRCDLGLTYFLHQPPDHEAAIREFELALDARPTHEKTLQFYIQSLAELNRLPEAESALEKLRSVNPSNATLEDLAAKIREAKAR